MIASLLCLRLESVFTISLSLSNISSMWRYLDLFFRHKVRRAYSVQQFAWYPSRSVSTTLLLYCMVTSTYAPPTPPPPVIVSPGNCPNGNFPFAIPSNFTCGHSAPTRVSMYFWSASARRSRIGSVRPRMGKHVSVGRGGAILIKASVVWKEDDRQMVLREKVASLTQIRQGQLENHRQFLSVPSHAECVTNNKWPGMGETVSQTEIFHPLPRLNKE